jgi:hypothetical protein
MENYLGAAIGFASGTAFKTSEFDARVRLIEETMEYTAALRKAGTVNPSVEVKSFYTEVCGIVKEKEQFGLFRVAIDIAVAAGNYVLTSRHESHLDAYGYDMVFGATLGAVNAAMKQYVNRASKTLPVLRLYYTRDANKNYVEISPDKAACLDGLKLFSIPNDVNKRTPEQIEAIKKAQELKAYYGFEVEVGLPPWLQPSDWLVDFNAGEAKKQTEVKYNLVFKKLNLFEFIIDWDDYEYHTVSQDDKKWIFTFTVDLGMVGVSLNVLPEEVKKELNNIDPSVVFSISQLYLDLNTSYLMFAPQIDCTEDARAVLQRNFIDRYFTTLKEKNGEAVFGYTITIPDSNGKNFLFKPADFRFWVSPYLKDRSRKELYTLNYIVQCETDKPINLRELTWDWIDAEQYDKEHLTAAMSISNTRICEFALGEYKKLVQNLLYSTAISVSVSGWKMDTRFSISKDDITPVVFDANKSFTYSRAAHDDDWGVVIMGTIDCDFNYDFAATVKHYQSTEGCIMECRVDTKLYLNYDYTYATSRGTIYDKTTYYTLTISVDEYGKLILAPNVATNDNGTSFSMSGWDKFMISGVEDCVQYLTEQFGGFLNRNAAYFNNAFINTYNGNAIWYLPGSGSLIFKQPTFSQNTDLTFDASYAAPKDKE